MNKMIFLLGTVFAGAVVFGQGRETFLLQQAQAEMQRVSGQVDVIQNNLDDLATRVRRLEGGNGETQGLRAEIESLKATVAELRRQLSNQRGEIVRDLSGRLAKMQTPAPVPAPVQKPKKPAYTGPCSEYTVKAGDSLYMIALAFNTTAAKLSEMNNLKNNNLRPGQKLLVPRP